VFIKINTSNGVPIYRQIADQVKVAVATGSLRTGDQLPSVRGLSETLVVNPTTVQRAYLELERGGVIETRRGQGTFVTGRGARLAPDESRRRTIEALRHALAEASRCQVDEAELRRLVEEEIARFYRPAPEREGESHG
jgi:GntR family transcriptional regulator